MASSTAEKVIDIIAEQLGVDKAQINEETSIANDLGADSLDTAELMIAFEEAFEINITEDPSEKIETVGQVIKYIESKLASDGGNAEG
ncbi:MAG: acyl carrier protein [Planctomycetaceae bacterium]|jgi:acyl carrier protein|nr:acyl carrier protein [Planctomycetaceae bacterium]